MATDTEMSPELPLPSLEGLTRIEARSAILPYVLQFITSSPPQEYPHEVVVLVDPTNRSISFVDGPYNPQAIIHEEEPLPASKASIEAMPVVKILGEGVDCTICLSNFEIGAEAKEMPCKHCFHSICIDKWLEINGSCPICRYKMPVDKERENKDEENGEHEREGEDETNDDGGSMEMEQDRVMYVFHVNIFRTPSSTLVMEITSEIDVQVHSNGLVGDVDDGDDEFEGGADGDEIGGAGNGGESEGGGNVDTSEAQDMVTDNN